MAGSVRLQVQKRGLPTKPNSLNSTNSGTLKLMTTAVTDGIRKGNLAPSLGGETVCINTFVLQCTILG